MSKTFKLVIVLLVAVSIGAAVAAVFAFIGKEKEYMKRVLLEDKLAATLKDKRRLEKEINANKKAKDAAEAKLIGLEKEVEEAVLQVAEEKKNAKAALLDLSAKEKEIAELKKAIAKEKKEKLSISKKLDDMESDYAKAKSDISRLKKEKTGIEKRMADLKEKSVDLDKIVVDTSEAVVPEKVVARKPAVKELLKGRVLVVNREYSFVVTDLGKDDGVENGMLVLVKDGTSLLGKAEVDKVYETMSSATVLPGSSINRMKKGNLIIESR